jgi:SAM-dependent methyltransferase
VNGTIGFYDENAEDFFRRSVGADMARGHADFTALIPAGGRILDAGCGSGRDSLAFAKLGFRVTSMEASAKLAALATAHAGLPVEVMTFDQIAWRDAFDGVWACASLLHVGRADLPAAIGRLRDALVPGGVLWMSFKYGAQERFANGRHFTDLDEAGATPLIEAVGGLSLISLDVSNDAREDRPGERWLSVLCRKTIPPL